MDRTKRAGDSGQTVDTFAVCSKCTRLSYNLKQCDKCGNPLSEDNAAMCVSAEPKRTRLDSPANATNGSLVNGNNTSHTTGDGGDASPSTAAPVPQALYKNINVSEQASIRPQALYMNMNFCGDSSSTTTSNTTSSAGAARNENNLQSQYNAQSAGSRPSSNIPTTDSGHSLTNTSSTPAVVGTIMSQTVGGLQMNRQLPPTLQGQPGPPPLVSTPSIPGNQVSTSFSNFNLPQPPPYTAVLPNAQSNNSAEVDDSIGELVFSNSDTNIALPATQIRIGTRKFLPASSVTFKEDGVLFALKDYTHAPVLLNARAIIKCEANMDTFPAFFVYLEATCIRQIRNIFNLTTDEFLENSPAGIKKCITIFPNVTMAVQKELRGRISSGIRKIFHTMSVRYPRPTSYLQEISNSQVIDLLFDTMRATRTSDVIPRGLSPSRPPVSTMASSMPHHLTSNQNSLVYQQRGMSTRLPPPHTQNMYGGSTNRMQGSNMIQLQIPPREGVLSTSTGTHRINQANSRQATPRHVLRPASTVRPAVTTLTTQSTTQSKTSSANTAGTTAPLLVVPSDQTKWANMQKDLVEGGVYHVELPTKERKYFLWDGARLVPCLVQNTEVQLNCIYLRIGSLRAEAKDVKVRADNPPAFMFTIKSDKTGTVPVTLSLEMISNCVLYNDGGEKTIVFVNLTHEGWWKQLNQLKLGGDTDPCFNPSSMDARRKHIVMVFKGINKDQNDALLGIKNKTTGNHIFSVGHHNMVLKVLSDIYNNIPETYFRGTSNKFQANTPLEIALKEFMSIDSKGPVLDDDDDDVIMTSEEVGIKCPYTQQVMKEPVKNRLCQHNYERAAIQEFIVRKKGNARCPYAGCGNSKPLSMLDLEDNRELKLYIAKHAT